MRAVSFFRLIDWLKPQQFVISTYPIMRKRTFAIVTTNRQSTLCTDIGHGRGRLDTSSNGDSKSLYSSEASNNWNEY